MNTNNTFDLRYENRFGGIARLYGTAGLEALRTARVAVVGLGGVGSWAAEALARSGIGALDLIDLDESCVTNTNRQLHAMNGAYGRPKVELIAERIGLINPDLRIYKHECFAHEGNLAELIHEEIDAVIDACDSVPDKTSLLVHCRKLDIPLCISGASGGKTDPTALVIDDLSRERGDQLLKSLKRRLFKNHGIDTEAHYGVPVVYSREKSIPSQEQCLIKNEGKIGCESGFGAAGFVTGAYGLALASIVVRLIVKAGQ